MLDLLVYTLKYGFVLLLVAEAVVVARALAPLFRRPAPATPPQA